MNTIKEMYIEEGKEPRTSTVTIFFESKVDEIRPAEKHCEIMHLNEIVRITLNDYSFTLIFKSQGMTKFSINKNFDIEKIAKLAECRYNQNEGLKVIEHFAKLNKK